jgi:hypothetical protein
LDAQLFTFRYSKGDCHLSVFQIGSSVRQKKSLHFENLEYLLLRKGGRFEVRKMRSFLVQSKLPQPPFSPLADREKLLGLISTGEEAQRA